MNALRHILAIFCFGVLLSCEKTMDEKDIIIAIDKTTYSVSSAASSIPISFVTNADWTVSSSCSWCKVTPNSGTVTDNNHAEFLISIEENSSFDKRTGQVDVKAGKKTVTIRIEQDCQYDITVSKSQYSVDSSAQTLIISVQSNLSYSVDSDQSWLRATSTKALDPSELSVSIDAYEGSSERTGTLTIHSSDYSIFTRVSIIQAPPAKMSDAGNCYMVKPNSSISFKAIKGNRNISVGEISSVDVVWETFCTDESPNVHDVVSSVTYQNGSIKVNTGKEGNALVAAKDAEGVILWSWHIWVTTYDPETSYDTYNNAGVMMNRNLGALSATPGDPRANGFFYQWGRKDPFMASSSITEAKRMATTIEWPAYEIRDEVIGTVDYATKHPTTFILSKYEAGKSGLWTNEIDNTLWEETKTIYDPCPPGWKVPGADVNNDASFYYKAGFYRDMKKANLYADNVNRGCLFNSDFVTPDSWYPCTGHITYQGSFEWVGDYGSIWGTGNNTGTDAWDLIFNIHYNRLGLAPDAPRANGKSVRCCRE